MKGAYIVFEGIDGSGKSTQIKFAQDHLRKEGYDAITVQEPSQFDTGEKVRDVLQGRTQASDRDLAMLFAVDRKKLTDQIIAPALKAGKIVLSDRSFISSIAYQSAAGLDEAWIKSINSFAVKPDLVVFLDVPPERSMARLGAKQRFERLDMQIKVREKYLKAIRDYNYTLIDGDLDIEGVRGKVLNGISSFVRARYRSREHNRNA